MLIFLIITVHVLVFLFAPAIREAQGRGAVDASIVGARYDRCEWIDEVALDQVYHLFECQRLNRFDLLIINQESQLIAQSPLGTVKYETYLQQNFARHRTSETTHITRMLFNGEWVWIVREAQREMRYDDDMNLIWEVVFAWAN